MKRIALMVLKSLPKVPYWFYRICRLGRQEDNHTEQERYDYLRKLIKSQYKRTGISRRIWHRKYSG